MENRLISKFCPETCIVFVTYGRADIAASSYESLSAPTAPYRERIKIVISDATDDEGKMRWARSTDADDVILTPRFTPSASSRNLATTLILDKYSPKYLCMLEDDYLYHPDWYPSLVKTADCLYGVMSPLNLVGGIQVLEPIPSTLKTMTGSGRQQGNQESTSGQMKSNH
jgi:hypothetical protein